MVSPFETPDKRTLLRLQPRTLVPLAMTQGSKAPPAYGIVSNISERGTCVFSDRPLASGHSIRLRIQFPAERDLFDASGRVAWTKDTEGLAESWRGSALSGIEFAPPSGAIMHRLRQTLMKPDFEVPATDTDPFEDFLESIEPYLDDLGLFISRIIERGH